MVNFVAIWEVNAIFSVNEDGVTITLVSKGALPVSFIG